MSKNLCFFDIFNQDPFSNNYPGTSVYGIRRYTRGAWLVSHLDHMHTHVVSAILNIGQQGNCKSDSALLAAKLPQ